MRESGSLRFKSDVALILARRTVNGGDYWATPDGRWGVGSPFSTLDCGLMLSELGVRRPNHVAAGISEVLFKCQTDDGRIRPGPKLAVQPCHTANAARLLCRLGYAKDKRLGVTFDHLLATQAADGGWRCNVLKFGASADTDASNPGVTLAALDALRYRKDFVGTQAAERAVQTLLDHWTVRRPLGPCRFGIGSRFLKIEYPFIRYNLFMYAYVLSFYPHAVASPAFGQALELLREKRGNLKLVVEHQNRGLSELSFCREGHPSPVADRRYRELSRNAGTST